MSKAAIEPPLFFLKEKEYKGNFPFFYDASQFKWMPEIESQWKIIKAELERYIEKHEQKLGLFNSTTAPNVSVPGGWKNIYLVNYLWTFHKNCREFPHTMKMMSKVPGLTFVGFAMLEPHSEVLPHYGDCNANIRCHLGLKIPAPHPVCGIRVGSEEKGWEEGKALMFTDGHLHTTWNKSSEKRYLFVFDVLHPEYIPRKNLICAQYLGAQSLKYLDERMNFLHRTPGFIIDFFHFLFSFAWYLFLPLQRRAGYFRR